MKVPDSLEALLDMMRAKGCASFDFERPDVGKLSARLQIEVPARSAPVSVEVAYPDLMAISDATPPRVRVSDIELALHPPPLDEAEEVADPSEALAPEATRESAPAGAAEPERGE